MFGGWDFQPGDDQYPDYVALGYEKGVPMGGELHGDPQAAAVRKAGFAYVSLDLEGFRSGSMYEVIHTHGAHD